VKAAVRPEDILVTDSPSGENLIEATVEVVEYQGRELAVEARTPSGLALHLRTERRLTPGDGVTLAVSPDRLLVYPLETDDRAAAALVEAGAP
jgi:putative spermidine/putrescine transport system ATP-binding protein